MIPFLYTITIPGNLGDINLPAPSGTISGATNPILALIANVLNTALEVAGALAVLALVYSGIMYITSGDNAEQGEKAKKNMVWAIIGVAIIALALVIIRVFSDVLTTGTLN